MKNKLNVGGVETFSLVDYPDVISAVVFLQGCPWKCRFCYNQSLQEINKATDFDWSKFVAFLEKRKGIIEGVVFSGGEPLVQDGLKAAIEEVKALGYKIGLHTGGYRPEKLKEVLSLTDWVGLDIKAPLEEERYQSITQSQTPLAHVLESLKLLVESGKIFECRTTCDPRDLSIADIYKIAKSLKEMGVKKYCLQKYRPIDSDKKTEEEDCEKFFKDLELKDYIKFTFPTAEFRH